MYRDSQLWIGAAGEQLQEKVCITPKMANRHGLIAGATGTGKTVTLKVMAESFSDCGVPVFLADVKGDLAGMCKPGQDSEDMQERIARFGIEGFEYKAYPTCFWDILGEAGHSLRTTISEMGPTLLAELLELNQTQSDILAIVFKIADDQNLLLMDIKDLRLMLEYVSQNAKDFSLKYGMISKQSVGAISRSLITLEEQGGNLFFGEPALDIRDWMRTDLTGRGYINILHCEKLIRSPKLYATFMIWMMSELFEEMPEAGDLEKPRVVFFFDEAHMLFDKASKALKENIEQMIKLIRSKGVGIYFITQNPADIPNSVLAQLGNRVQHALRAYTPAEQKAIKAISQSFRVNPTFSVEEVITQLGTGEALLSFLDEDGIPGVVQKAFILPPQSKMGTVDEEERKNCMFGDGLGAKYDQLIDRESAYELLSRRFEEAAEEDAKEQAEKEREEEIAKEEKKKEKMKKTTSSRTTSSRTRMTPLERGISSAASTLGREVTKTLFRGFMNTLKKR